MLIPLTSVDMTRNTRASHIHRMTVHRQNTPHKLTAWIQNWKLWASYSNWNVFHLVSHTLSNHKPKDTSSPCWKLFTKEFTFCLFWSPSSSWYVNSVKKTQQKTIIFLTVGYLTASELVAIWQLQSFGVHMKFHEESTHKGERTECCHRVSSGTG
jgi:hypothetical protein